MVETTLLAPFLIGFVLLIVWISLLVSAQLDLGAAAHAAARAASLARTPAAASRDAQTAAAASLGSQRRCRAASTSLDLTDWRPGGQVTATVTCTVNLSDLVLLPIPSTRTLTASSTAPIDVWRTL